MITDAQMRRLMKLKQTEKTLSIAAAKAGISENTAREYIRSKELPSQKNAERDWRTRQDPFEDDWPDIKDKLETIAGLETKTLFEWLQRQYPGKYSDGQLRTLQRKVKHWRATEGEAREVFFPQQHFPGQLGASDFTDMSRLGITIARKQFKHLVYHFVLTYSNWETGSVCFSESLESLLEGFQNALWELGGVPEVHRTDRLSAAVNRPGRPEEFTQRYAALMRHYRITAEKTQAESPNENGDVEQRHHRFKRAVDQALLLRGSRDFTDRSAYQRFLDSLFKQVNAGRSERLEEERKELGRLPERRLESYKRVGPVRVSSGSLIQVHNNSYSVHSRLIGEQVSVRLYAEHLEVWYAQRRVEVIPRLRGQN